MLVEHTFVTTLEADDAMLLTESLLARCGFSRASADAASLHLRRGAASPSGTASFADLPQNLRLHYDRGRVTVAASGTEGGKPGELHKSMLLALVRAVECLLSTSAPIEECTEQAWRQLEDMERQLDEDCRRRRRRTRRIVILSIIGFIVALVVFIAWAVNQ